MLDEPRPGQIADWIDAHYTTGDPGSAQEEFRMILNMHLHHGVLASVAVAMAMESVGSRRPGFIPERTDR